MNYGSRSCISFIAKQQPINTLFIYCSLLYCKHCFPHHTFNPLWSAKPVGLLTSLFSWGKVSFVLCAGSTLPTSHSLTSSFWRHCQSRRHHQISSAVVEERQTQHLQKRLSSPPGSINLGFILRENLLLCIIITLSLGYPTQTSSSFLAPLPGRRSTSARGVLSHTIFYFVFSFACFLFVCFLISKNTKKISCSFYSCCYIQKHKKISCSLYFCYVYFKFCYYVT